jgi:hypothetical protein
MICLVQLAAHIQALSGAGAKPAQVGTARYPDRGHHEDNYGSHEDKYGSYEDNYGSHEKKYGSHEKKYGSHEDNYGSHEDGYGSYSHKSDKGYHKEETYGNDGYDRKEESYGFEGGCPRSQPSNDVSDGECALSAEGATQCLVRLVS